MVLHRTSTAEPWRTIDERQLWPTNSTFQPSEKGYQVRIDGPATGGRLIHAVSVGAENPPHVVGLTDGVDLGGTQVRVVGGQVVVSN